MGLVRFIAGGFSRCSRRFSTSPSPGEDPRHWLGRRGETLAARYLRRHGYKVLARNFRPPGGGEVDLVCRDGAELVFVEIKTRRSERWAAPADAVDLQKQELLARGALAWLRLLDRPEVVFRFDIVEVLVEPAGETIRLWRSAFSLPERYRV